jgi:hypothetical protein
MVKQLQLFEDVPAPITGEAQQEMPGLEMRMDALSMKLYEIAFKILVWGPSLRSQSAVARKRREIYQRLKQEKHKVWFSEEFRRRRGITLYMQEKTQAEQSDLIILLVEENSPGSIGEMHDFCRNAKLITKIYLLVPKSMQQSYNADSVIWTIDKGYGGVYWYEHIDIAQCHVLTAVMERVEARRSLVLMNML